MGGVLWGIITLLFVLWVIGFAVHFAGGLIHLLLVAALVLLIVNLLSGRRASA
jgi:hypothetical protein